jgi:hypothetical protein
LLTTSLLIHKDKSVVDAQLKDLEIQLVISINSSTVIVGSVKLKCGSLEFVLLIVISPDRNFAQALYSLKVLP